MSVCGGFDSGGNKKTPLYFYKGVFGFFRLVVCFLKIEIYVIDLTGNEMVND
jgi:hypothetical protein